MPEESAQKKSLFIVIPVAAYAFIAAGVLNVVSQISQAFAGQGNTGSLQNDFAHHMKAAALQVGSPFTVLLCLIGLVVFAAVFYVRPRDDARQGWFFAVAAAGLVSILVAGSSLYDLVALLAGDDDFSVTDGALKFSYICSWIAGVGLAGAGLFVAIRLWTSVDQLDHVAEEEEDGNVVDEEPTSGTTSSDSDNS
jgi:hypothetical protein